jgi:hypothetical protein
MAQNNQTIANFYDRALAREFSRDFLFRVAGISFAAGADSTFNDTELIYAKTATLPSRQITNVPTKYMGLQFNLPGVVLYPGSDNFRIKFYCDAASALRNKFLAESRRVFDESVSTGDYNIAGRGSIITLMQLDKQMEPVTKFTLLGASIREVGSINYNISDGTGQTAEFEVGIAYHFFEEGRPT